jgi:hypothetical protein
VGLFSDGLEYFGLAEPREPRYQQQEALPELIVPQPFPSIYQEASLALEYADRRKFTTGNLMDRKAHYSAVLSDSSLSGRTSADVLRILDALDFELMMRAVEARRELARRAAALGDPNV